MYLYTSYENAQRPRERSNNEESYAENMRLSCSERYRIGALFAFTDPMEYRTLYPRPNDRPYARRGLDMEMDHRYVCVDVLICRTDSDVCIDRVTCEHRSGDETHRRTGETLNPRAGNGRGDLSIALNLTMPSI